MPPHDDIRPIAARLATVASAIAACNGPVPDDQAAELYRAAGALPKLAAWRDAQRAFVSAARDYDAARLGEDRDRARFRLGAAVDATDAALVGLYGALSTAPETSTTS